MVKSHKREGGYCLLYTSGMILLHDYNNERFRGAGQAVDEYENCFTISDKARCIAGSVVEGLQMLEVKQVY